MNRLARFAGFGRKRGEQEETAVVEEEVVVEHVDPEELRQPIIDELRKVHDPEIPVNIYDLGLIYRIEIAENGGVHVDMTLTAPGCPVAGVMPLMVKSAVARVEGVGEVDVALVWDPPWNQDNMSDEARLQLGLM
ncbi:SUF system Fe-S cluster assembly protein [Thiorhodococcus mannitoliphagus]|uniref:SUF system Fe-S cluster assembly protein n=1 Tax=Thiorhodococcus mannitoliphagus TaxID=329406 RepID=A0A6P1DTY7_9GAMM|nr:SUF system Fe-S cluster assembly protein [Thiorhodococcus mannitoliphagus]NEX21249.1 SUF system Fe-S cluster assembly protein [Thiorhodococcus mannitoliphagus]